MNRDQASFDAVDGVELHLLNGQTVRCPALTVKEALRYLRLFAGAEGNPSNHDEILRSFPERIGIMDVRLVDIGLEAEGPDGPLSFGNLTVQAAFDLLDILGVAMGEDYASVAVAEAQVRILDEFPETLGIQSERPTEVFGGARAFAEAFYLRIYGLAQDFCGHLTASPPVLVMTIRAPSSSPQPTSTT